MIRFLGGVYLTIILILCAALFVIAGTILESVSDSHMYAAWWTYDHWLFKTFLWLLAVNIIVAALRRWPFKVKHIPFLTAHIGLVMILAGTLMKSYFGIQGSMLLTEGSGSSHLIIPHSGVLTLEDRIGKVFEFPVQNGKIPPNEFAEIVDTFPHHELSYAQWTYQDQVLVKDQPIRVLRTPHVEKAIQSAFSEGLKMKQIHRETGEIIHGGLQTEIQLNFSKEGGFDAPKLLAALEDNTLVTVPLSGPYSLLNQTENYTPVRIELERPETFLLIKDEEENHYLVYFDSHGRVECKIFPFNDVSTIIVYDRGFGGYAVQADFEKEPATPLQKEEKQLQVLKESLGTAFKQSVQLTPPIALLGTDSDQFLQFLIDWDRTRSWTYPREVLLSLDPSLWDWDIIPPDQLKSAYWSMVLLQNLQQEKKLGDDYRNRDPWRYLIAANQPPEQSLTQQMFAISETLPDNFDIEALSAEDKVQIATILLRAYGLHLRTLLPEPPSEAETFVLESSLVPQFQPRPPLTKLEDNRPLLMVKVADHIIPVGYDPYNSLLKWPILNGKYLVRYHPKWLPIPYHVRLREGRSIAYPDSQQTFSYECDLIVTGDQSEEVSLSMNHVHQTWDGYRFYLSNVIEKEGHSAKKVQLVINYDPARYYLTYPGGGVVALGIILLFWMRPYRKSVIPPP